MAIFADEVNHSLAQSQQAVRTGPYQTPIEYGWFKACKALIANSADSATAIDKLYKIIELIKESELAQWVDWGILHLLTPETIHKHLPYSGSFAKCIIFSFDLDEPGKFKASIKEENVSITQSLASVHEINSLLNIHAEIEGGIGDKRNIYLGRRTFLIRPRVFSRVKAHKDLDVEIRSQGWDAANLLASLSPVALEPLNIKLFLQYCQKKLPHLYSYLDYLRSQKRLCYDASIKKQRMLQVYHKIIEFSHCHESLHHLLLFLIAHETDTPAIAQEWISGISELLLKCEFGKDLVKAIYEIIIAAIGAGIFFQQNAIKFAGDYVAPRRGGIKLNYRAGASWTYECPQKMLYTHYLMCKTNKGLQPLIDAINGYREVKDHITYDFISNYKPAKFVLSSPGQTRAPQVSPQQGIKQIWLRPLTARRKQEINTLLMFIFLQWHCNNSSKMNCPISWLPYELICQITDHIPEITINQIQRFFKMCDEIRSNTSNNQECHTSTFC